MRRGGAGLRAEAGLALALALALWSVADTSFPPRNPPRNPPREFAPCPDARERFALRGESHVVDCAAGARGGELRGPARLLFGLGIDPNRASASTLESLPGIGPGRAAAILAARAERPFRSIADLARVPGIGPVSIERIATSLRLEPASQAPGAGNR